MVQRKSEKENNFHNLETIKCQRCYYIPNHNKNKYFKLTYYKSEVLDFVESNYPHRLQVTSLKKRNNVKCYK